LQRPRPNGTVVGKTNDDWEISMPQRLTRLCLALAAQPQSQPQSEPAPLPAPRVTDTGIDRPASALFVGNSFFYFNNGMHSYVTALLRAADPLYRFRSTMAAISGSGANWHDMDSYFRPNAIGGYSFDADNDVVFNQLDRLFDLVVIMDCSQCPVHPRLRPLFEEYMRKHSDTVRRHGAVPVFFMSWAYADRPQMTAELAEAYTRAGNDNGALVVPAGLAFANALRQRPDLVLHAGDRRHPSVAGTYLAACTVYASLFKRSPADSTYTASLEPELAKFLQNVAWETVQQYHGRTATAVRVQ
jgi:hypothetical protein